MRKGSSVYIYWYIYIRINNTNIPSIIIIIYCDTVFYQCVRAYNNLNLTAYIFNLFKHRVLETRQLFSIKERKHTYV